jgi:hypothetical protein
MIIINVNHLQAKVAAEAFDIWEKRGQPGEVRMNCEFWILHDQQVSTHTQ